jgi:hypothetical protein
MGKLGYRERMLLPGGNFFRFRILSAEIDEEGKFGAQLALEVKTLGGGKYGGHVFTDWSKLATDEDTGDHYVVEDGKAEEIFRAAGQDPTRPDIDALVGKVFMARVGVSDNGKRNRLEYGSIGRIPEDEEDGTSGGGYVEGEDEPDPTE